MVAPTTTPTEPSGSASGVELAQLVEDRLATVRPPNSSVVTACCTSGPSGLLVTAST